MARITANQLRGFTPEEAVAEFGWGLHDVEFDRPGIYRWLDEGMRGGLTDFTYLGDVAIVPLPTKAQCVKEYGHCYDTVAEARRAVQEGWSVEIENGVLNHTILPASHSDQYIRVVGVPESYQ
jgi:hypothetical protein